MLYRTARAAMRARLGGPLSSLLNAFFLLGVAGQTGFALHQQIVRQGQRLAGGHAQAQAGEAAAVFLLDIVGMLLLMPPAMIRADGIAGRQRAAVDSELWLTLPLSGPQRVVARLGQATFFLTFLGFFLLGHFLGPAVAFAPRWPYAAPLFCVIAGCALLLILGGGASLYALLRRYLRPAAQGRIIAWTGLGLLPISYAYFGAAQGRGGAVAARLGAALSDTPLCALLLAAHRGDLRAAAAAAALLLLAASAVAAVGYGLTTVLLREAADDIAPLGGERRYPGGTSPIGHLRKDLLLRWRDPGHRGALIGGALAATLIPLLDLVTSGQLAARWRESGADPQLGLSLGCFAVGMAVLVSAGQWVPLEARTLDWLRVSGIEPRALLVRKGLAASVEALLLALPVSLLLLLRGGLAMTPALPPLWLFSLGLCWFIVGDTAARFPEARRDTRPVQLRSLYAGYLVMLASAIVLPLSLAAAAAALCLLAMGALGRIDAGIDALTHLDEVRRAPREVRFADAWPAGAAAALAQGLAVLLLPRLGLPLLPAALAGYSAAAVLVGAWSLRYLRGRMDRSALGALLGPPRARGGYLLGLGLGLVSLGAAALYLRALQALAPQLLADGDGPRLGLPARAALALLVVTLAPLTEELFFRGWIQEGLRRRFSLGLWAVPVQALLFAALHPALSCVPVLVLGTLCGAIVRRTGSLRPAVLLHAIHNAGPALLLLVGRGGGTL